MIKPDATLEVRRIPLRLLHVREYQSRYPDRLLHYIDLLSKDHGDPGVVCVKPHDNGTYEILDGHHRYCAMVMTGRTTVLCLVIDEPEDPTIDDTPHLER